MDNTLLSTRLYEPEGVRSCERNTSQEEFLEQLPTGGILLDEEPIAKVYPRPHLEAFIKGVKDLGYDLALCTTASLEYIELVLPLCGIDPRDFLFVQTHDDLKNRGFEKVKDIRSFVEHGYALKDIVAIDDRPEVHKKTDNVLKILAFHAV
ncbi:NIF family HAD-type phosphatase, partial [Gilvimarinus sp. SDUM040013]